MKSTDIATSLLITQIKMDGLSIESVLRADPHVAPLFEGVFAADTLPRYLHRRPALIIVNTDPISKAGEHWQAIFVSRHGRGEFFCSYGLRPFVRRHIQFLNRMCKSWEYNTVPLQAIDSDVCGQYCIMYLIHKAHGYTLKQFLNTYFDQHDKETNDAVVACMVSRYTKDHIFCDDFIVNRSLQSCTKRNQ